MQKRYWSALALTLVALPAMAQQSGSISGKLTGKQGQALAGVRIDVTGNVLPQPRRVTTNEAGDYRLPFLPPGEYVLTYTQADKATQKRGITVVLGQNTTANVTLLDATVVGAQVEVVADKASLVDATSAELKTSFSSETMNALPVGQDYRDLVKLIPGVMYTQDAVRGPSAGGSGQDNVHQFDGVNVNLPMYGTMSSQPSGHDIDQITISKGGADAVGFNRSAGYTINSISKSGTNALAGELSYQTLPNSLVAKRNYTSAAIYEQTKTYAVLNVGGPILTDKLFYFLSFYRPTVSQQNSANNYGTTPDYSETRKEYFGKLTYAPTQNILIHASLRDSDDTVNHSGYGGSAFAATTGQGGNTKMKIATLEATWNVTPNSFLNFKTTNFIFKSADHPDYLSSAVPSFTGNLDVNSLNTQGQFKVPVPGTAAQATYNAFVAPIITKYGYLNSAGVATGGGTVGGYNQINNQNFFRRNYELAYDATWGASVTHTFHAGVQWSKEMEDLYRVSNGWGSISAVGAFTTTPSTSPNTLSPYYFVAAVNQQGISGVPTIHSEYETLNYELNDKIKWNKFTFNVGLVISNDKLYGSGLREDPSTVSGYVQARGNKYLEHEVKAADTLQPRLGITYNYAKEDTVYANYARFVPSVSSLPRASSWDRNLAATVNVYFDATGRQVDHSVDASSTGKLWQANMKPRHTDEFLIGTTKDLGDGLSGRLYGRYRHSVNFWEDTNNGARVMFATPTGIPKDYYIPNLNVMLNQLQGQALSLANQNNAFVVAQLDNAFTKYYEACMELEWKGTNAYVNLSYSWSHYYGNFDQDNSSTTTANDSNVFVGSSNIGDDWGRQVWNNKYGNLSGDRRHKVKLFGTYKFFWQGQLGVFLNYQSGQPWQYQDYAFAGYAADKAAENLNSTSDTNRYAESAGSHVTAPHYFMDLSYTQIFWQTKRFKLEGMVDVYNVFNKQTGYNIQSSVHSANPGLAQTFYSPRRTQLGVRFLF